MANLLQSSQTQATEAPQFYTNYLANLATQGQQASQAAQFAGAQPLQTQAFEQVGTAGKAFQPTLAQAGNVLSQAAGATSPLAAGAGYLEQAAGSPAALAQQYMNPYIGSAVQNMSDIAMRNLQQNLTPMATAATVGSGQYGSQRGAQVLGQVQRQAMQDLNANIANMLATGYGQALQAGTAQNQLLGQLGATAGQQASAGQQNLTQAGGALNQLAQANQALNLADINALATLGGQQQTIAQNAQNYPLTKLQTLASLLQGQQIPSTVRTQLNMAPLSGLASLGALSQSPAGQKVIDALSGPLGTLTSSLSGLLSGKTDVTEVPNSATEGQPGYGWKYFSDGTSIDPEGNYYRGNEKIWSPAPGNTSDTGTSNTNIDPNMGSTGDPIVDNAMTNTEDVG